MRSKAEQLRRAVAARLLDRALSTGPGARGDAIAAEAAAVERGAHVSSLHVREVLPAAAQDVLGAGCEVEALAIIEGRS